MPKSHGSSRVANRRIFGFLLRRRHVYSPIVPEVKKYIGETISFLHSLAYIHVLSVIRWSPTYSFPSANFSNHAITEKLIAYLLYLAVYPYKYYYNFYRTEDTLGIMCFI